VVFID